eukprot:GHVQ01026047.1.p1 GENE.GHVQ01026047.1~~GHVQ01026047.1.p1  ORF type:complete len:216 (-),score=35.21 GHVQ01026047.1:73-720(-)
MAVHGAMTDPFSKLVGVKSDFYVPLEDKKNCTSFDLSEEELSHADSADDSTMLLLRACRVSRRLLQLAQTGINVSDVLHDPSSSYHYRAKLTPHHGKLKYRNKSPTEPHASLLNARERRKAEKLARHVEKEEKRVREGTETKRQYNKRMNRIKDVEELVVKEALSETYCEEGRRTEAKRRDLAGAEQQQKFGIMSPIGFKAQGSKRLMPWNVSVP